MKLSKTLRKPIPAINTPALPAPKQTYRAANAIFDRWPNVSPKVEEKDRKKIAYAFLDRIKRDDWKGCTVDDAARAGRAVFDKDLRTLDDLSPVRKHFFNEIQATAKPGILAAMVEVHIETFETGAAHTKFLAQSIKAATSPLPLQSHKLLDALPEALDPAKGAVVLGKRMALSGAPDALFKDLGVRLSGGLIDGAGEAFVSHLAPTMREPAVGRICLDWFVGKDDSVDARLGSAPRALDALIAPWHRTEPPAKWKETLLRRLPQAYGDPRLTQGGVWGEVRKDTRDTFIRWLTGATLEVFLDIVSKAEDSHMWADRRPFWQDLYRKGHIQQAWVAFSRQAAKIADTAAASSNESALRSYGRQVARGNTSLLILKINGKTVVEGSHSYKVHVFPPGHPNEPEFYLTHPDTYDCEAIRLSLPDTREYKVSHHGDSWKRWVIEKTL